MNAGKKALIKSPLICNKNFKRKPLRKRGIEGHFLSSKRACGREGPTLPLLCPLPATLVKHVVNSAQFPLRFPASYPVWSDHMTRFWPKGYEWKWLWQFLVTPWKVRSVPSLPSSSSPVGGMQMWGWQLGQTSKPTEPNHSPEDGRAADKGGGDTDTDQLPQSPEMVVI